MQPPQSARGREAGVTVEEPWRKGSWAVSLCLELPASPSLSLQGHVPTHFRSEPWRSSQPSDLSFGSQMQSTDLCAHAAALDGPWRRPGTAMEAISWVMTHRFVPTDCPCLFLEVPPHPAVGQGLSNTLPHFLLLSSHPEHLSSNASNSRSFWRLPALHTDSPSHDTQPWPHPLPSSLSNT